MGPFTELAGEYRSLWSSMTIRSEKAHAVANVAVKLQSLKARYDEVSIATTVPWFVVGLIHSLESDFDLTSHLHNGDPLAARTIREPKGHPKNGSPPFTWSESALDALIMKGMHTVGAGNWSIERIAYQLEIYNGTGYRDFHPSVKTPYLWSGTNHFTAGKYIRDHVFDPAAPSDQIGAMAVLRQLIDMKAVSELGQADIVTPPPVVPSPVPTGLFLADTVPFRLRDKAAADATSSLIVSGSMPVTKVKEMDELWWQVSVVAPDMSQHAGFARRDWLKAQTVMSRFVVEEFAQACLDAARHYGTSAHFLLALADAETGLANGATAGTGDGFGPFALTSDEWRDNNASAETGYTDADRFDPLAQTVIAARLVVKLTKQVQEALPDKRLATSEELFMARLFGVENVALLLDDAAKNKMLKKVIASADTLVARRPGLLSADAKVADLRAELVEKLTAGFEVAITNIIKIEPDLVVGPAAAAADAAYVPWMAIAKAELAKDIREFKPGSNPDIEKYFLTTTIGKQTDDVPWCGAFVSWCIEQSNGKHGPIVYSATASDWLNNGKALPGPAFGAVAVMRPLVPRSSGHVGFVESWDAKTVSLLGGNQGDRVCEEEFNISDVRSWRMV